MASVPASGHARGGNGDGRDVRAALRQWSVGHARASLNELEDAVDTELAQVRAQLLAELTTRASATLDTTGWPRCATCGGALQHRGTHRRRIVVGKQAVPLELERSYGECPTCKVGIFPPG